MRLSAWLAGALVFCVVLLSASSAYSAWVSSQNHRNSCTSRGLVLDIVHDVIKLALTPDAGQTLTSVQVQRITSFEASAFARIDQGRC